MLLPAAAAAGHSWGCHKVTIGTPMALAGHLLVPGLGAEPSQPGTAFQKSFVPGGNLANLRAAWSTFRGRRVRWEHKLTSGLSVYLKTFLLPPQHAECPFVTLVPPFPRRLEVILLSKRKTLVQPSRGAHAAGRARRRGQQGRCLGGDLAFPSSSGDTKRPQGQRQTLLCPYLPHQWRPRLSPAGSERKKDTKASENE